MLVNIGMIAECQVDEAPKSGKVAILPVITVLDKKVNNIRGHRQVLPSHLRYIIPREAPSQNSDSYS